MKDKKKFILTMLYTTVITLLLYISLHEFGYILFAIAFGAKITDFSIMKDMSYIGENFNQITQSLFYVVGMLLPVLICLIFILLFNRNIKNMFYICFSTMFFVLTTCSILAWVIIPFISMFSTPPAGDDVTKFLIISGYNQIVIILSAVLLIAMMVITALYKGVFKSLLDL